jgi:group I intron endonuclease
MYVGQSKNIEKRWYEHKWNLNRDNHRNNYLQNAWNKYGKENFEFIILENITDEELNERENYWITYFDSLYSANGYNLREGGANRTLLEETRIKLRQCNIGENNPSVKITEVQALKIIELLLEGYTSIKISKITNISDTIIRCIKNKWSWTYLTENIVFPITTSSPYLGVSWHKKGKKWRSELKYNRKQIHLGLFVSEIEAAKAYDKKAIEMLGNKAKLNFQDDYKSTI